MSFITSIELDTIEVEIELNTFFRWKEQVFPCTPDKFMREVTIAMDGNPEMIDLRLRCRVSAFDGVFPRSGEFVQFPVEEDGSDNSETETFRVRRTNAKQYAIFWIECISTET